MKVNQLKMIIREVVREEIQLGLKEIIGEINQPIVEKISKPKKVEQKHYSKNSVLNDVLNETAAGEDWKTLGGGKLDSSQINKVVSQNYGDMMNGTPQQVPSSDPMSQFVNKDYSDVLKKTKDIDDRKHGR
tara:strand:+ start:688 stop:1080 length:393 start_codon:yes stop_codon:yes gene_type:complete